MGSRISEEDDESERRSTPPGTIGGESQDVMSEKIGYSIRMLNRKTFNHYQKSNGPMAESKIDTSISLVFYTLILVVKERIPLPNDTQ